MSAPDSEALGYTQYFAELLDEWAQEADPDERLYRLGASMVQAIVDGAAAEPLARYFEFWLLRLQGVYPPHLTCHQCGAGLGDGQRGAAFLEVGDHEFTCVECSPRGRGLRLSAGALASLSGMRTVTPFESGTLRMTPVVLRELESVHRTLIASHLEKELRSIRVLKSMRR